MPSSFIMKFKIPGNNMSADAILSGLDDASIESIIEQVKSNRAIYDKTSCRK